ncbi:MAG: D-alanyl-D-alanine endopeptidase [Proteobacteria bacterium]|nr:D-alanyl-D-alanine endopeptidase [Pseudomonadota bacterium]
MRSRSSSRGSWWWLLGVLAIALSGNVWAAKAQGKHTAKAQRVVAKPAAKSSTKSTAKASAKPAAKSARGAKAAAGRRVVVAKPAPRRPSLGEQQGLHQGNDPLELKSSVALVVDQDTNQVLVSKNPQAVLPIASITKLMTAMVVTEARLDLNTPVTVTEQDVDTEKGSRSRLKVGTQLTRGEMLHLALMSSENRAAHALGRSYPGGMDAFVALMNATARRLGMTDTHYVEPTGLSSSNRSSARDLTLLVKAAYQQPLIRELSTSPEAEFPVGARVEQFRNTNGLVRNPAWDIGLQKTGYIAEAGRCLVMQAQLAGRKLILVLLDSAGKYSRIGDAERIRHWLAQQPEGSHAANLH